MSRIEVEVRGPLTSSGFKKLKNKLAKVGKFKTKKTRLSLIYFRKDIPKDINNHKNETIDLRLRITNGKANLVMKYGKWGSSDTRREIELPIAVSQFDEAVELLKILGWYKAVANVTEAFVYVYKNIEFALIKIFSGGYYFEAEIMVKDKSETAAAKEKIAKVCRQLGLAEYGRGGFERQCNKINNNKNFQFDFSKHHFKEFEKKFKVFLKLS